MASDHGPGGGALQIVPLPRLWCDPRSPLRFVPLCGQWLVPRFSPDLAGRGVVTGILKHPACPVPFFPSLCIWDSHAGPPNPGAQAAGPCALIQGRVGGGLAAPRPWGFESHWPCFIWVSRWLSSPPQPCPPLCLHDHWRLKSGLFLIFGESGSPGEELHPHSCCPDSPRRRVPGVEIQCLQQPGNRRWRQQQAWEGGEPFTVKTTRVRLVLEGRGWAKTRGLRRAASRGRGRGAQRVSSQAFPAKAAP